VWIDADCAPEFERWLVTIMDRDSYVEVAYRERYASVLIPEGRLVERPKLKEDEVFVYTLGG
jgi:hypothetical protein